MRAFLCLQILPLLDIGMSVQGYVDSSLSAARLEGSFREINACLRVPLVYRTTCVPVRLRLWRYLVARHLFGAVAACSVEMGGKET